MDLRSTMMDPTLFVDPTDFCPGRWLDAASRNESLERWLMPFSRGTRNCLGQKFVIRFLTLSALTKLVVQSFNADYFLSLYLSSLALGEIYITIAILFRRFEFELFETDARAVVVTRDRFAAGLDKKSKGTRVKLLKEYLE